MAISVADNFSYLGTKPLDSRISFDTVSAMAGASEATLYDGCFAYVKATQKYYSYDSTNTSDPTTGKWREYSSGGGGGTNNYPDLNNKPSINGVELLGNKVIGLLSGNIQVDSDKIGYNNTVSGLTATNVKAALDELASGSGGTSDYPDLTNKPSINGVELLGDKVVGLLSGNIQISADKIGYSGAVSGTSTTKAAIDEIQSNIDKNDFVNKTWSGLSNFYGDYVWSDGDNIYYSYRANQYVLDKSTSTWNTKNWSGLSNFDGDCVWSDGSNIYYSEENDQYVLDKSTSTWSTKTWSGYNEMYGGYIWSDGSNIYYSNFSDQYVLDKATSTWSEKTWNGLSNVDSESIWSDGSNIYHSVATYHYVLDKATSTWSEKTWNGLTVFSGDFIWSDGKNVYYSHPASGSYVLDKSTSTWSANNWGEYTIDGRYVWTDGDDIYLTDMTNSFVLIQAKFGIPSGGNIGQVLAKKSNDDYGLKWKSIPNITASSTDITAGTTALTTGDLYLVYE